MDMDEKVGRCIMGACVREGSNILLLQICNFKIKERRVLFVECPEPKWSNCGAKTYTLVCDFDIKGHIDGIKSLNASLAVLIKEEPHNIFLVISSKDKGLSIEKLLLCVMVGSFDGQGEQMD